MQNVLVLGMGKVGVLVARLFHLDDSFNVTGMDAVTPKDDLPFKTIVSNVSNDAELRKIFSGFDAVVSCLPYQLNLAVAEAAHDAGIHYFDLTEDVPTTRAIMEMSKTAKGLMAPQCGLAPGFIGIVGADLAKKFEKLRSIELRVGALPQHPSGKLGYAFNWSPVGVVNEYLNDCEVISNGQRKTVPPLEALETIYIDGQKLEAFTTSGGLGTMCETYAGKVTKLDYKTMRYPGHRDMMEFFFKELHMQERRDIAGEILVNAKPPVNDDVVYVHASVEGDKGGHLYREEFVHAYRPKDIDGQTWRAISWTTAASVCAVVEMVKAGDLPQQGFLKQEDIPLSKYLNTRYGSFYKV